MKPFCLMCGVSASIKSKEELAKKYEILDCQLEFVQKRRMHIKPDGYCLPRAIFTALKK